MPTMVLAGDDDSEIDFSVEITDPSKTSNPIHRTPIHTPIVHICGYELNFVDCCDGCTLQILEIGADIPVYSTIIPSGTQTLQLPTNLSGQYELRIIRGNYCFWGIIEL